MGYYSDNPDMHFNSQSNSEAGIRGLLEVYNFRKIKQFKAELVACKNLLDSADLITQLIQNTNYQEAKKYIDELTQMIEQSKPEKEIVEKIDAGLKKFKENNACTQLIDLLSRYVKPNAKQNFGMTVEELVESTNNLTPRF